MLPYKDGSLPPFHKSRNALSKYTVTREFFADDDETSRVNQGPAEATQKEPLVGKEWLGEQAGNVRDQRNRQ